MGAAATQRAPRASRPRVATMPPPAVILEGPAMRSMSLAPDATLSDVAKAVGDLHACLAEHRKASGNRAKALEGRLQGLETRTTQQYGELLGGQRLMMQAFGINPAPGAKQPRTIAALPAWSLAWRVAAPMATVLALWSWGGKVFPVLEQAFWALNHAVTGA